MNYEQSLDVFISKYYLIFLNYERDSKLFNEKTVLGYCEDLLHVLLHINSVLFLT